MTPLEKMTEYFIQKHGLTPEHADFFRLLCRETEQLVEVAIAAEREAIAQMFDKEAAEAEPGQWGEKADAEANAAMIRARTSNQP